MTTALPNDLDDLKQRLHVHDGQLQAALRLNGRLLRATIAGRAATPLSRLTWLLWAGLAVNAVTLLWLGAFAARHVHDPRFLLPALFLHVGVIVVGIAPRVRQLAHLDTLDWAAPVVRIQAQLAAVEQQSLFATRWTLLLAPLAWLPLVVVAMKGLLGVNAYAIFDRLAPNGQTWVLANLLFGVAVIPVGIWVSRRLAARMDGSPRLQRLMRDLAGSNLAEARRYVDELADLDTSSPRS